jgi:putative ABC transport system substrate-binding protein
MKSQRYGFPDHVALVALVSILMLASLFFCAPPAWGQLQRVIKIGVLTDGMVPWTSSAKGFHDGLQELGYVEGRNVTFDARTTQGDSSRLHELAAQLMKSNPDLLFCISDACWKQTGGIPMVFTQVSDPVRIGLVQSMARPGGDITGIASLRADLSAKRLELFKEIVGSLRRVLVTYDLTNTEEKEAMTSVRSAARRLGLQLLEQPIRGPLEIEAGLGKLEEGGEDGILIVQEGTNLNIPGRSLQVATSNNLPTMYPASFWSQFGALASYGPDQYAQGRQAARLAHKILTGTPPREMPVEFPDRIEFVINLNTAKRISLQVPQPVLLRADRFIN